MALQDERGLRDAISRYSWYHCIELAPGITTPGYERMFPTQRPIMDCLRQQNVTGKRVLDIGCRDGLFSFEAERMGAAAIVGIDNDLSPGAIDLLIPFFKSSVQMKSLNVYDLVVEPESLFDLVIFAGVLYHLRFPFFGLKRIADAMRPSATLLLETAVWATHDQTPLLYTPPPDESPYEPTSVTFYNDAGLRAALGSLGFIDVTCHRILREDRTYANNWSEVLTPDFDDSKIRIVRGTYTATKSAARNAREQLLDSYWFGTHTLNSDEENRQRFLISGKSDRAN